MRVKARFLRRPDVAPLPEGAPVTAIAQWLAHFIEEEGHLDHGLAVVRIHAKFGDGFVLSALKKLTGNNIIWGKECRKWWAKNARGRQAAKDQRDFRRSESRMRQSG
jgi:hypothetical protein